MDFMQAVADGNAEHVKKALAGMSPWEVNKPRRNKSTALMVAASLGNFDITRMLIDAEAALDVQDTDEQTALMYSICGQNEDVVTLLLEAGARGDTANWRAFDFAVRFGTPGIVKMMLDRGADVNRRDDSSDPTPFLDAVARGNREIIEMLIKAGADISVTAGDQTAVSIAFGVRGNEMELTTRNILAWFREMDAAEPFRLVGCKFDTVSIVLERPVSDPEAWAVKLSEFCPDSFHSDDGGELAGQLRVTTRLTFWWD